VLASGGAAKAVGVSIAVDAASVYWVNSDGAVMKCATGGCNDMPTTLASPPSPGVSALGLAVDATHVYWVTSGSMNGGIVLKCAVGGCGGHPTVLVSSSTGYSPTGTIAVNGTGVYWGELSNEATVMRSDLDGASTSVLAAGQNVGSLVADGNDVYWTHDLADEVLACPAGGCVGSPTVLASNEPAAILAVDGANVYWTLAVGSAAGSVRQCAVGGCNGKPTTIFSGLPGSAADGITVDGANVYWAAYAGDGCVQIMKCAAGGCGNSPTTIYSGEASVGGRVYGLAVDATSLYWNRGDGAIMKIAK
jgi:hypothetical protein